MRAPAIGDPSESALLKFAEIWFGGVGEAVTVLRRNNKKVCEIPFNSTIKYQV